MNFQIHSLAPAPFDAFFKMSDAQLLAHSIVKTIVTEANSTPCRVSLKDADVGATVLLLNHQHLQGQTPFQASHAIFVTQDVQQSYPEVNQVPQVIHSRMVSIRAFDKQQMMVQADIAQGLEVSEKIQLMLNDKNIEFLHLHYAKHGCYIARVTRDTRATMEQESQERVKRY